MLELGRKQKLVVVKKVEFGVYLGEEVNASMDERVLLPMKQVPENAKEGDEIEVFLYKDSSDRLIATVREAKLSVGEFAVLKVVQVGKIGAFLDWGLEKDLLLPFSEQTKKVSEGEECLVALYVDKSDRLCATMKVYPYLFTQSPYGMGDMVTGRVYENSERFGVFVAIDDKYSALVPRQEAQTNLKIGEIRQFRVTVVREDGKLNLSVHQKAYIQMDEDAKKIMDEIDRQGGKLPFDDKAAPEVIKESLGLSKNAFKRAVGRLYKERKIIIKPGEIVKAGE